MPIGGFCGTINNGRIGRVMKKAGRDVAQYSDIEGTHPDFAIIKVFGRQEKSSGFLLD